MKITEPDVLTAIESGKKVTAIKLLRQSRGIDLAQAKQLIDEHCGDITPANRSVDGKPPSAGSPLLLAIGLLFVGYFLYQLILA
ncbi:hypothetical protein CHH28_04230 [Bacterioplanes sanyensis]|uniref:Ribosomal protein L7/L12 C-terminal domain-containing protein n=1 Tax=Bacterioplanes sanyensis TaxID=1249553 RepID=A0A222FH34_9GAMM|nr:hypothetical protein [Bacterioplanes sanyensis]ASP37932.1 hypothetical protein CHH28_04230 [Bacterioplanes sanyensis]